MDFWTNLGLVFLLIFLVLPLLAYLIVISLVLVINKKPRSEETPADILAHPQTVTGFVKKAVCIMGKTERVVLVEAFDLSENMTQYVFRLPPALPYPEQGTLVTLCLLPKPLPKSADYLTDSTRTCMFAVHHQAAFAREQVRTPLKFSPEKYRLWVIVLTVSSLLFVAALLLLIWAFRADTVNKPNW